VVLVPSRHPLLGRPLSLTSLVRFPIVTYVPEFTGRRRIDQAFAQAGLKPDVVLAAIDSDVIKTYVGIGLGVGIMAELAYDASRDRGLTALPAGALFGVNHTRLAVRRDSYLRGFAQSFIELFAPNLDRVSLERMMRPGVAAAPSQGSGVGGQSSGNP
jgi:LysR family cys regulon transcriptional activator